MIRATLNSLKDMFPKELISPEDIQEKKKIQLNTWAEVRLEPSTSEDGNVVRYTCIKYKADTKN